MLTSECPGAKLIVDPGSVSGVSSSRLPISIQSNRARKQNILEKPSHWENAWPTCSESCLWVIFQQGTIALHPNYTKKFEFWLITKTISSRYYAPMSWWDKSIAGMGCQFTLDSRNDCRCHWIVRSKEATMGKSAAYIFLNRESQVNENRDILGAVTPGEV